MFQPFPTTLDADFPRQLKTLLDAQRNAVQAIARTPNPSYETILKPLQDLDEERAVFFTPLSHRNSVMNSPATQEAYAESIPLLSAFHSELSHHTALFHAVEKLPISDDAIGTVIQHTLRDFVLAGARLNADDKKRLEAIDLRLSTLSNTFSQHVLDATRAYSLTITDPNDVAELPASDRETARTDDTGHTVYRFTLQAPSYIAYMTYGSNRAHRQALYLAHQTRAPENGAVIDEILRLRHEKSTLLGYKNYAHYALQTRDAPDETSVLAFLENVLESVLPHARRELKTLQDFAYDLDRVDDVQPWDLAYYGEKLKKSLFDIDDAMIQPFLEQSRVVKGLLALVSEVFGITFRPVDAPVWHPSVRTCDLYEAGHRVGRIYFDLDARPEKRGGAWMHDWETHYTDAHGVQHLPSAFVVAGFSPATASQPSLLRHDDVVTLFHEMGHALHHLLGRGRERAVSGINGVAWDAIEFPSQFLENFAYEAPILRRFAFHYETQEPLSETVIARIKHAKNFHAALGILRQIEFSLFDFQLHRHLYQGEAVQKLLDGVRKRTALITPPPSVRFQNGFSHIFAGGYAAGYYSYKWAEVLSADAFFYCRNAQGDFDSDRAKAYRHNILAPGGSRPMNQLMHAWLKREPNPESLLHLYGIGTGAAS